MSEILSPALFFARIPTCLSGDLIQSLAYRYFVCWLLRVVPNLIHPIFRLKGVESIVRIFKLYNSKFHSAQIDIVLFAYNIDLILTSFDIFDHLAFNII